MTTPDFAILPDDAGDLVATARTASRWQIDALIDASLAQDPTRPHLLAPIDRQVVKACGVIFVESQTEPAPRSTKRPD